MRRRAQSKAAALGVSLSEYLRRLIATDIAEAQVKPDVSKTKPKADISILFDLVNSGPLTNVARDKDKMVGQAVWEEYFGASVASHASHHGRAKSGAPADPRLA